MLLGSAHVNSSHEHDSEIDPFCQFHQRAYWQLLLVQIICHSISMINIYKSIFYCRQLKQKSTVKSLLLVKLAPCWPYLTSSPSFTKKGQNTKDQKLKQEFRNIIPYQNFPLFVKNLISLEDIFAKEFLANLCFASHCVNKFFCSPISEPKKCSIYQWKW